MAEKKKRPQGRSSSPQLKEEDDFSNFMHTKLAQGKEALQQVPFVSANPTTALEDILNDDNII